MARHDHGWNLEGLATRYGVTRTDLEKGIPGVCHHSMKRVFRETQGWNPDIEYFAEEVDQHEREIADLRREILDLREWKTRAKVWMRSTHHKVAGQDRDIDLLAARLLGGNR